MVTSKSLIIFFQISLFLILSIIPSSFEEIINGVKCQERERQVLLKFKSQLIDDYGRLSTWGTYKDDDHEKDCCKWEGVICDNGTNRVVGLDLGGPQDDDLSPSSPLRDLGFDDFNETQIPEFICSLEKIQHLNLGYSSFLGPIPHCLANLSKLQFLDLNRNQLHETSGLDWLSSFESLEYLDLSENNLHGIIIPQALGNLTYLSHIYFTQCGLKVRIPDALGKLTSLSNFDLSQNSLEGKFPDALGKLTFLSHLDLSYNNLEGIPDALWNITSLSFLDFSHNQLRGEFNGLLNLSLPNLKVLDLSDNMFTGHVPNLSSCSSFVRSINLGSNLLEGLISEAHLFNLSKLQELDLSFNSNLTVKINAFLNPPFQLETLHLASCKLGPYFPRWLQNQEKMEVLDISYANISDSVPDWLWDNIHMCGFLDMSHNKLYGVVPVLSSMYNLMIIDLRSNEFNGSLPLLPPAINTIKFSGNKFSGTITNTCYLRNLHVLDLSNNLFSTHIPQDCFINLMSLRYMNLANNNFSGEIPNSIDSPCFVSSLHLRNNSFTGEISRSLKNCNEMTILDLGENKFNGKIPDWLGESMLELAVLSLKSNHLYGRLPSSLCRLQNIQVLDISMNKISGTIPKCLKNLTILCSKIDPNFVSHRFFIYVDAMGFYHDSAYIVWKGKEAECTKILRLLTIIDLSNNNLIGEIPRELISLVGLIALNLSGNNLVGSIPRDIDQLKNLNFLDLSKNNLSGGIPSTLAQLSHLGVLDLSFNNLSGKTPWIDDLQAFNASVYIGNPRLCGPPLILKPCPSDKTPVGNVDETHNQEHDNIFNSKGFYVSMALGFIVAFWGVSGTLFLNKWCRITIGKMLICVEDWLYIKIMISKNRLKRYLKQC
ncbi:Leucine-rich repeat protein [Handroanthus impetiginosus]|uniref:Leucine-rich repeat protein n=1 Tax=Handroanthus impetiginosus TaxID=429701 RepID=A0A2G9I728_9LAMI|nr:Leucine-rich repeat protein [Handroanthus impetiginosus]